MFDSVTTLHCVCQIHIFEYNSVKVLAFRSQFLWYGVLWILYWQYCCNVEITIPSSQRLHKVDIMTSNSKRYVNVTSTLDSKLTSHHIMDIVMATLIQLCNRNVKLYVFLTSILRRSTDVASALRRITRWHLSGI